MPLYVLGLNHRTAPIDIREKVAFTNDRQRPALEALRLFSAAEEVVLVSTCNRTELYLRGADDSVLDRATEWLQATPEARHQNLLPHLYRHADADVARHAFRVAAGLDSMVLGEPQILGQVKYAVKIATEAGTLGGPLNRLFQETFQIAKKVRSQTEIGATSVSMAAAALKLAKQLFGDIREIKVLFIGVGEMIHLSATHFAAQLPKKMVVANRTLARGRAFASEFGTSGDMSAIALAELPDCIHEFDAIITSTASSLPIIGKGMVELALKRRRNKPIFMVDLAVPRDIEPGVGELEDVYLYSLDTLGKMIQQNMAIRASAVVAAEAIIDSHTTHFMQWLSARSAVPVIQEMRGKADHYRQVELERAQKMLAKGDDPRLVLEALAHGLTNKFLHHPMAALKSASGVDRELLTNALEKLYPEIPEEEE